MLEKHTKELLDKLVWKITESESMNKLRTRYCSLDAYWLPDEKLEHEHVFEKEKIINQLLKSVPSDVERVLSVAVACTVTKSEHNNKLGRVHKSIGGWDRYNAARIPVVDVKKTQESGGNIVFLISPESFMASPTT